MIANRIRRFLLSLAISGFVLMVFITLCYFIKSQTSSPRRLEDLAKPLIKMDLLAPRVYGWLSDHEIFFLREKNQGDFLCVKTDINDGSEMIIEELSPFLQDLEDRSKALFIKPSPSGKRLALLYGDRKKPSRVMYDFDTNEATKLRNASEERYQITWLSDESGWISWQFDPEMSNGPTTCTPTIYSIHGTEKTISPIIIEGSPLIPPYFNHSTNLVFATKHSAKNLALESMSEHPQKGFDHNRTHTIAKKVELSNTAVDASQNVNAWLITYMKMKPIPKVIRWHEFPFFRLLSRFRGEVVLYDLQKQKKTVLESDLATLVSTTHFPYKFDLNPSGSHFSFTYRGQIWIAKLADFIE